MILPLSAYLWNISNKVSMKGVFSSVNSNSLDILSIHAYTKALDFRGLAESTKAGGFKMRQYLKQYESKLID